MVFEESRSGRVGGAVAKVTRWALLAPIRHVVRVVTWATLLAEIGRLVLALVDHFEARAAINGHLCLVQTYEFIFDLTLYRFRRPSFTVMVYRTGAPLKIIICVTIESAWACDLRRGLHVTVVAWTAFDRCVATFRAVVSDRAGQAIDLGDSSSLVVIRTWCALERLRCSQRAVMTTRALTTRQVRDRKVVTGVAFGADGALVLPDALLPAGIGAGRARVDVCLVDDLVAHDGAPVTLWARVVVVVAPLADVAGLAAAAVCDLALRCLHTHCLEWAARGISRALRTIVTFVALAERGVRHCVESGEADVACDALVDLLAGATVHFVGAYQA
mmetsp:Transcript_12592/g.16180  ORF Transcript_12592/g.16180 Transcript_12592/m.16180 type:complete len:331 (-) Transcript_12592:1714-2706(-)